MAHAPIKLLSMLETDMPAISEENSQRLVGLAFQTFFLPLAALFESASARGEIRGFDSIKLAGNFLSIIDGISYATTAGHTREDIRQLIRDAVDVFLNGARPR